MTAPSVTSPDNPGSVGFAFDGTLAVPQYCLMFHDTDDVKPAASQSDAGSEAANQAAFAPKFAGVALDSRTVLETNAETNFPVATDIFLTMDCASATFEVGDLVTVDEQSGGTALENQKLVKTTDRLLAIGYATKRHASATTRIEVRLTSRVLPNVPGERAVPFPIAAQQALSGAGAVDLASYYTAWTTVGSDGADAGTLADGLFYGQRKRVQLIVDADDGVLTPVNLSGGTTITFADAGDFAELVWNGTEWVAIQLGNDADGATGPVLA